MMKPKLHVISSISKTPLQERLFYLGLTQTNQKGKKNLKLSPGKFKEAVYRILSNKAPN